MTIHFVLVINKQSKIRLAKYYSTYTPIERKILGNKVVANVIGRKRAYANVVHIDQYNCVYRRYANLYFVLGMDDDDNELLALEIIHRYVLMLDKVFERVSETDLIYGFEESYRVLDELLLGGEVQETSLKVGLKSYEAEVMNQAEYRIMAALETSGLSF
eukprot:TRINITY_DN3993_c0_g1_i3.p1 TRINITY_DN3993_c0_g1~~TRINITY_DN3993_c0_g1_i3.p1  ORF type:complete len:160 (+),score=22.59 TRINITY_DN3993_c0_g1_i3:66-545(+)